MTNIIQVLILCLSYLITTVPYAHVLTVGRLIVSLNKYQQLAMFFEARICKNRGKIGISQWQPATANQAALFYAALVCSQKVIVGFQFLASSLHHTGMRKLINCWKEFFWSIFHDTIKILWPVNFCFHEICFSSHFSFLLCYEWLITFSTQL